MRKNTVQIMSEEPPDELCWHEDKLWRQSLLDYNDMKYSRNVPGIQDIILAKVVAWEMIDSVV